MMTIQFKKSVRAFMNRRIFILTVMENDGLGDFFVGKKIVEGLLEQNHKITWVVLAYTTPEHPAQEMFIHNEQQSVKLKYPDYLMDASIITHDPKNKGTSDAAQPLAELKKLKPENPMVLIAPICQFFDKGGSFRGYCQKNKIHCVCIYLPGMYQGPSEMADQDFLHNLWLV